LDDITRQDDPNARLKGQFAPEQLDGAGRMGSNTAESTRAPPWA